MLRRHVDGAGTGEAPESRKKKSANTGRVDECVDWNTYIGGFFARG